MPITTWQYLMPLCQRRSLVNRGDITSIKGRIRPRRKPRACTLPTLIWVNYNISLTWIKAIWGWFPLLIMIPVRSQWGRYNLPRLMLWSSNWQWKVYHFYAFQKQDVDDFPGFSWIFPVPCWPSPSFLSHLRSERCAQGHDSLVWEPHGLPRLLLGGFPSDVQTCSVCSLGIHGLCNNLEHHPRWSRCKWLQSYVQIYL